MDMTNFKMDNLCQSCGMPLFVEDNKGTTADGGRSQEYCKHCFENGEYKDKEITLDQQIVKVVGMAVELMHVPEATAMEMAKKVLPELKRWK